MNLRRVAVPAILLMLALPAYGQAENFLPDDLTPITAENADELSLLARIGRGLVYDIQWAEDGESLFVSASTGVWEYPTAEGAALPDAPVLAPDTAYFPGILSANGQYLAQRNNSGGVRVRDLNGETVTEFQTNASYLRIAFSGDGQTVAAVSSEGAATVVRVSSGVIVGEFTVPSSPSVVALNTDGSVLAAQEGKWTQATDSYDSIGLYNTTTGEEILRVEDVSMFIVGSIRFTPDGSRMIATALNAAYLWDLRTGDLLQVYENAELIVEGWTTPLISGVAEFSPDESQLAVNGHDFRRGVEMAGVVYVWDAATGDEIAVLRGMPNWSSRLLAFSPDGSQLAYYAYDGAIRLWDTSGERDPRTLIGDHYGAIDRLAIHPDGSTVAISGFQRALRWFSLEGGGQIAAEYVHGGDIGAVVYDAFGRNLATASPYEILLWQDSENIGLGVVSGDEILALAFALDGSIVYGITVQDANLYSWQARVDRTDIHYGNITLMEEAAAAAFNTDVSLLALGGGSGRITLYDPVTLEEQAVLEHTGEVSALEFSPDGALLVASYADGKTVFWDVASGEQVGSVQADAGVVNAFAFNPDGTLLAAGNSEGTVSVWDVETRELLGVYEAHLDDVLSVALSPDGTLLLAGSWDGTISVWGVE